MFGDLQAAKAVFERARAPEDIFGFAEELCGGPPERQRRAITVSYRHLAAVLHPDRYVNEPDLGKLAQDLFTQLTKWKDAAEAKIEAKTYGNGKPHEPEPPKPVAHGPQVIQTPKRKYIVTDLLAQGDLADLYKCSYTEGKDEHHAVFKIAQSAADNDLLENEQKVLSAMYPASQVEEKFYRYLPKPYDSFLLRDKGANRRVNVLQRAEGYTPLTEVMRAHPAGIDFRDMVWIFKRGLAGLGYAHSKKKVVHGAVLPPHLLAQHDEIDSVGEVVRKGHGAKIVDWCYAVPDWGKGKVKAISKAYRSYYAPEILAKNPVTPQTDLFMLAKCMIGILGGNVETNQLPDSVPKQIRAFLNSCLIENPTRRPDNAWDLHEEFEELLLRIVGKRAYRPLIVSTK